MKKQIKTLIFAVAIMVATTPLISRAHTQDSCANCFQNNEVQILSNKTVISLSALKALADDFKDAPDTAKVVLEKDKNAGAANAHVHVKIINDNKVIYQDGEWL